jgi:hypothetical protein
VLLGEHLAAGLAVVVKVGGLVVGHCIT